MMRITLAQTLMALIEGATPPHDALQVDEAEISLPLILRMEAGVDGPQFFAQPPWSAYRSGFEPITHRMRFSLQAETTLLNHQDPAG